MSVEAWSLWIACPLCGGDRLRVLFVAERSRRQVVRCRGCGLVFYDPQPSARQLAALYDADYFESEFPPAQTVAQARLADRRLARIEAEAGVGRLLDVGCGPGVFLAAACARGWTAAGLDPSSAAVRIAAGAARVPVLEGDLRRSRPDTLEPVDVVTLWDVLEHLRDPVADLAEIPRWLRPGGLLVAQTQNVNSITARWMGRRWEQFVEAHLVHFSPRTLGRALERAGFEAIRVDDVARFTGADADAPAGATPSALWSAGRHLRDLAFRLAGYDPFNTMVVTARRRGR